MILIKISLTLLILALMLYLFDVGVAEITDKMKKVFSYLVISGVGFLFAQIIFWIWNF